MKRNWILLMLFLLTTVAGTLPAAEAKIISNIRISDKNQKLYFNIFQSSIDESLWYCGQTKPSILMRELDEQQIPDISLIRFQRKDPKNPQKLVEGAHFRMNLSLGATEEILEELKNYLPKSAGKQPTVLSPVPFQALRLVLQSPSGKEVEMKAEPITGIGNQRSSRNVSFSLTLGTLDTDLLDCLMRGTTGAKYILYYNYKYRDPVLAEKPTGSSEFTRNSGNRTEQTDNDRNLPGTRDFSDMEKEAEAASGWQKAGEGFIGFSRYSRTVQNHCIFIESAEKWQNAYLALPTITFPPGISVSRIELDVALMYQGKSFSREKFTWNPVKKWRDRNGAPVVYGVFDLGELAKLLPHELKKAYFSIKQTIESAGNEKLVNEINCEMLEGDTPVSNPVDLADVLEFEMGSLHGQTKNTAV
jgi:hypothetical protein